MITLEALRVLTNSLTFTGLVNRQFDPMFGKSGAKVGDVIYARKLPNPSPAWFGFHEVFHIFVMLGTAAHFWTVYRYVSAFA